MDFLNRNTELRKLPVAVLNPIIDILNSDDSWITLMNSIPKDLTSDRFEPKYNIEHIRLIRDHAELTKNKYAKVLFDEWGTSGRVRPTLNTLKDILVKARLFRAADEVADMLQEPRPERPSSGPAKKIVTNITFLLNNGESACQESTCQMQTNRDVDTTGQFDRYNVPDLDALLPHSNVMSGSSENASTNMTSQSESYYTDNSVYSQIDTDILENTNLIQFPYEELQRLTQNFTNAIGSGGFGVVYVGNHPQYGMLAIKRAHNIHKLSRDKDFNHNFIRIFNREVRSLSILRHENIVPILGFSLTGPCIVCRYITGGSLMQKIAEKVLNEHQRIKIMIGVAEGLKYIHTTEIAKIDSSEKYYFMHGDVKSANILLSEDFTPKLCDFGLSNQYSATLHSISIKGTLGYMAPESLSGTVTQKSDIYSYGIVMLEILTGCKPIVKTYNGETNIKDYVAYKCPDDNITNVLDSKVENWSKAAEIYKIAKHCLLEDKDLRPPMKTVCMKLNEINLEH